MLINCRVYWFFESLVWRLKSLDIIVCLIVLVKICCNSFEKFWKKFEYDELGGR